MCVCVCVCVFVCGSVCGRGGCGGWRLCQNLPVSSLCWCLEWKTEQFDLQRDLVAVLPTGFDHIYVCIRGHV